MNGLGATLALAARSAVGWGALRQRAVRDELAATFAAGLGRALASASAVAVLLGVILLREVLPRVPWFGRRPDDVAAMLLFAVQHLGDLIAGILVVGQAGLVLTAQRASDAEGGAVDSPEVASAQRLARVWALAALYVFVLMFFKVLAVASGALVTWALDGHFVGAEIGEVLRGRAPLILGGYALNAAVALGLGALCVAPGAATPVEVALPAVFRRSLVLIFAAKLLAFRFESLL